MKNDANILNEFKAIDLSEINKNSFLDRKDTKFFIPEEKINEFLERIKLNYLVLQVNGARLGEYETHYFDTPDLTLYKNHHHGKLNRYKIRIRTYVNSALSFLEVKFKSNKGRTVKSRIKYNILNKLNETALNFIKEKGFKNPELLVPSVVINYRRITLLEKNLLEKITIDTLLHFKNNNTSKSIDNIAIIEIKQHNKLISDAVMNLKKMGIKPVSISKYCLAIISLYPNVAKNNFKPKLHQLNKIRNDRFIYSA